MANQIFELCSVGATALNMAIALGGFMVVTVFWMSTNRRVRCSKNGVRYPPHVRSWIPYLGSSVEMVQGPIRDFIQKYSQRFDNAPAFTAWIAGQKCVFLADSSLVGTVVYQDARREIDSLSMHKKLMRTVAGLPEALVGQAMGANKRKHVMAQFHQYLISDEALAETLAKTQTILAQNLQDLLNTATEARSLFEFVRKAIYMASTGPLLSEGIANEDAMESFRVFDEGFPLLFAEMPSFLTRSTRAARWNMIQTLQAPRTRELYSPFMQARRQLLDHVSDGVFARFNLMELLGSVSNSIPAVFWTLYNVLSHPEAYQACREEVDRVVAAKQVNGQHDEELAFTLAELDQLQLLHSAFLESLRLYQIFFVVRDVKDDFVVNPKEPTEKQVMLEKGTRIMALPNTMHMDPEIFEAPHEFRYDRFMDPAANAPNGLMLKHYLRPFGGGAHLCPGRKFIGYEARALLALLLADSDMKLVPGQAKPGIQLRRQGSSVAHPDRTVWFTIRRRQRGDLSGAF